MSESGPGQTSMNIWPWIVETLRAYPELALLMTRGA